MELFFTYSKTGKEPLNTDPKPEGRLIRCRITYKGC